MTVQLANAHDGYQLWSDRFDRDLGDDLRAPGRDRARDRRSAGATLGLRAAGPSSHHRPTTSRRTSSTCERREAVWQRSPPRCGAESSSSARRSRATGVRACVRGPRRGLQWARRYQYTSTVEARRNAEEALTAAERADPTLASVHLFRGQCRLTSAPNGTPPATTSARRYASPPAQWRISTRAVARAARRARAPRRAIVRAVELDPLSPFVHAIWVRL